MRQLLTLIAAFWCSALLFSCQEKEAEATDAEEVDYAKIPGMVTHDVAMYVSDSGVIKYFAQAPTWLRFDLDKKDPYQYFPDGLQLDQLDTALHAVSHIQADTAYNFERRDLWHLIKNVNIYNIRGERFRTSELFWDARAHTVYSDSFIHIERPDAIIEGYGFTSNDNFTKYELRQTTGIFDVKENRFEGASEPETAPSDSLPTDSTALEPTETPRRRGQRPQRRPQFD